MLRPGYLDDATLPALFRRAAAVAYPSLAEGFGMPCHVVDGNDFFGIHEAAGEAIERARRGDGPSMIHARLHRYYGHFEGDAMTYRGPNEVETLRRERDPLVQFRRRVTEGGLLEAKQLDVLDQEIAGMIDAVTRHAKSTAVPAVERLLTDVYVSY